MPTYQIVSNSSGKYCWRPYSHLYLNATSALTCPLMENAVAAKYRIYGENWNYYTTLSDLLCAQQFCNLRHDMVYNNGYHSTCGKYNCDAGDRELTYHCPFIVEEDLYWFKFLALSVTDYCHGSCRHCYQAHSGSFIPSYVLNDLIANARSKYISLMGGEIFHLPPRQIEYYLNAASHIGEKIVMQTSGDGPIDKYIEQYNWGEIRISIDALSRELHNYIRRGIDYDRVWDNLSLCVKALQEKVIVIITAMRTNIEEIPALIQKLSDIGVRHIRVNPIFLGGRATPDMLIENNLDLWADVRPNLKKAIFSAEKKSVVIEWPGLKKMPVCIIQQ